MSGAAGEKQEAEKRIREYIQASSMGLSKKEEQDFKELVIHNEETAKKVFRGSKHIGKAYILIYLNSQGKGADIAKESDLLLIDLSCGEILFQDKVGENEFYITSNGTRCYFYLPGKEESGKLFGMIKIPAENAVIYYRDTSDWTQKHTVYTFDYVAEPDIDTSDGVLTRIKFYISENQLKVAWTSYESVGNGDWEYLEKKAYDISLAENAFQ